MPIHALRPLSIAIVASKDLSLNTRVVRQTKALRRAGHRVTLVAFRLPAVARRNTCPELTVVETGAPVSHWLKMAELWTRHRLQNARNLEADAEAAVANGHTRSRAFARRALYLLAGAHFDIVQAHFDKALAAAHLLRQSRQAKLVFDAVEFPFDDELIPKSPIGRALRISEIRGERQIAQSADAWITVNDSLADLAVRRFGIARPFVLPNYYEAGPYPSDGRMRRDLRLGQDARILLHLNTMRPGEGLETIIDALADLPDVFHLVALGPVPEPGFLSGIRRRAAQQGVSKRFHIAPLQQPDAVLSYIAGADIGVIARKGAMQNLRLSLPNRLFQMIAARLPVVATPLPEIARIVREWRIGMVIKEGDAQALASAVVEMASPSSRATFQHSVDHAAGQLIWEPAGERYVRFVETVHREGRNPVLTGGCAGIAESRIPPSQSEVLHGI